MLARTDHVRRLLALPAMLILGGCALVPQGYEAEVSRLDAAGRTYARPSTRPVLPPLPDQPGWRDILHRALVANGDLEAAYHEWAAAMHRVPMAAAYPNTNLAAGFEYMFTRERMKAWDRTTLSAGADPMSSLALPQKVAQAGKVAFEQARAAGERFAAAKFDLQRKLLSAWADYALLAEKLRIQRENVDLLRLIADTASQRVQAGGAQQDLLKSDVALRLAENELRSMESELPPMRAMLNAMLGRGQDQPLPPPAAMPTLRPLPADDATLLALAVSRNPELSALAHDVAGRRDALALARMRYLPDLAPSASITGSIEKALGTMVMLPTNLPMIRGGIAEARAMLRGSEAMARQARLDRGAAFVGALYSLRNSERQIDLFRQHILPAAERVLATTRQGYAAGAVGFVELIDSQRMLLEVRVMVAEAHAAREKRLAELEALAGVDVETLTAPATRPATARSR